MANQPASNNLLLTGPPSCGKTTAILGLSERLADLHLAGFHTRELREGGTRVGFEAVGLSTGRQAVLAHVRSRSRHRVGRYGVEAAALVPIVEAELRLGAGAVDLFIIDEIGKMELLCPEFVDAVRLLLDGPRPVVATVALTGGGLIEEVKGRSDVRLVEVTPANRDGLAAELEAWVRELVQAR
jgi:nucleoside-triphosphatase